MLRIAVDGRVVRWPECIGPIVERAGGIRLPLAHSGTLAWGRPG